MPDSGCDRRRIDAYRTVNNAFRDRRYPRYYPFTVLQLIAKMTFDMQEVMGKGHWKAVSQSHTNAKDLPPKRSATDR